MAAPEILHQVSSRGTREQRTQCSNPNTRTLSVARCSSGAAAHSSSAPSALAPAPAAAPSAPAACCCCCCCSWNTTPLRVGLGGPPPSPRPGPPEKLPPDTLPPEAGTPRRLVAVPVAGSGLRSMGATPDPGEPGMMTVGRSPAVRLVPPALDTLCSICMGSSVKGMFRSVAGLPFTPDEKTRTRDYRRQYASVSASRRAQASPSLRLARQQNGCPCVCVRRQASARPLTCVSATGRPGRSGDLLAECGRMGSPAPCCPPPPAPAPAPAPPAHASRSLSRSRSAASRLAVGLPRLAEAEPERGPPWLVALPPVTGREELPAMGGGRGAWRG